MKQLDNLEAFCNALVSVMTMSEEEFNRILHHFSEMQPVTSRPDLERKLRELTKGTATTSKLIANFTEVAIQLYMVSIREADLTQFIHDAANHCLTYRSIGEPRVSLDVAEKRLSALQTVNSVVSLLARSKDVLSEIPRKIIRTRILSDIRPVFADGVDNIPAATVLIHTLVLEYKEGSVEKQFHVSFDSSSLRTLSGDIARAEAKEKTILELVKASRVTVIQPWSS